MHRRPESPSGTAALAVLCILLASALAGCRREAALPPPPQTAIAVAPAVGLSGAVSPTDAVPQGMEFADLKSRVDWRARMLASGTLSEPAKSSVSRGQALFAKVFTPQNGLGPFFNNTSCLACHNLPDPLGHGSPEVTTHFWAGEYPGNDANEATNPRLMPRFTAEGHAPFAMPPQFVKSGDRLPPQLMGLGWIEAVPGEQIRAQPHLDKPEPGVHTEPKGWVPDKVEAARGTMRFGLKPAVGTVDEFIIGALHAELGVTTPNRAFNKDDDTTADPEMTFSEVVDLANFVAFSTPPARPLPAEHAAGLETFKTIGCAACHWSAFTIEGKPTPQFYSDLLVHDMGKALADVHQMESTPPSYSRSTPLWSMHLNPGPYLHDGRAPTVEAAILAHAGEGTKARDAFAALDAPAKKVLVDAVRAL